MNRGYVAGCCLIIVSASLGYWIFSDDLAHRPPPPSLTPQPELAVDPEDRRLVYTSRESGDVIDLGRVFEPTGEELDLRTLLHGQPFAELVPFPREAEPEQAPLPREARRELLHAPRVVRGELPESGEEASSPPQFTDGSCGLFSWITAALIADWLSGTLPLKGILQK